MWHTGKALMNSGWRDAIQKLTSKSVDNLGLGGVRFIQEMIIKKILDITCWRIIKAYLGYESTHWNSVRPKGYKMWLPGEKNRKKIWKVNKTFSYLVTLSFPSSVFTKPAENIFGYYPVKLFFSVCVHK